MKPVSTQVFTGFLLMFNILTTKVFNFVENNNLYKVSIKKRIQSFEFAFKGMGTLFKTQANARIHLMAIFLVTVAGYLLKVSTAEWCFIVMAFAMVLAAEAFNTAVEFVVDLTSPDYHPLAGKAKDVAAAAVLITAIGAAIIGFIIFLPKLLVHLSK